MIRVEVLSDRPVPKPLLQVLAYSNEALVVEAARYMQMSEDTMLELFFELRLYFYLCYFYAEPLPAPIHLDALWHIFLGREEEYTAFCRECFGGVIEHIPHVTPRETGITKTIDRAHEKFGARLAQTWQRATRCDGWYKAAA